MAQENADGLKPANLIIATKLPSSGKRFKLRLGYLYKSARLYEVKLELADKKATEDFRAEDINGISSFVASPTFLSFTVDYPGEAGYFKAIAFEMSRSHHKVRANVGVNNLLEGDRIEVVHLGDGTYGQVDPADIVRLTGLDFHDSDHIEYKGVIDTLFLPRAYDLSRNMGLITRISVGDKNRRVTMYGGTDPNNAWLHKNLRVMFQSMKNREETDEQLIDSVERCLDAYGGMDISDMELEVPIYHAFTNQNHIYGLGTVDCAANWKEALLERTSRALAYMFRIKDYMPINGFPLPKVEEREKGQPALPSERQE